MKIKNNTQNPGTWCGQEIQPGAYHQIGINELVSWQTSGSVMTAISSGDLVMNDDFNDITNVALAINLLLEKDPTPRDSAGRPIQRQAITEPGNHFELLSFEIRTSYGSSCTDDSGNELSIHQSVRYDSNGQITTDPAQTVVTDVLLTWPTLIQGIGGVITQKEPATQDAKFYVTAFPGLFNIPFGKGGVNLALIGIGGVIDADAKAPKDLPAIPGVPHFRLRVRHPAGLDHKFQFHMKIFTA